MKQLKETTSDDVSGKTLRNRIETTKRNYKTEIFTTPTSIPSKQLKETTRSNISLLGWIKDYSYETTKRNYKSVDEDLYIKFSVNGNN